MKNSRNRATYFIFVLAIFIIFGVNKGFADPQPLPFNFMPGIGDLVYIEIDNDGGDPATGNPFMGDDCFAGQGLNIGDVNGVGLNDDDDAYDGAWITSVNTSFVGTDGVGDLTGSTYTGVSQNISGLDVTYELFFSSDTLCNRTIIFLDNPTGSDITETVRTATNLGSDNATQIEGTSSGDLTFTTADRWIVTSEGGGTGDPIVTTVYYGPGLPISTPDFVTLSVCNDADGVGAEFEVIVPAGESRCLMFFGCVGDITQNVNSISGALAAAPLFNINSTIPGDLLSGLSEQQLEECLNWDFVQSRPIPTLSEWSMIAMAAVLGIIGLFVLRRRLTAN